MIGEGDFLQHTLGAVLIECGPPTVATLESHHPFQATLKAFVPLRGVFRGHFPKREQDHGGVIHVGIPFVLEFKHPPTRLDFCRVLVNPVTAKANFLRHKPFRGFFQSGMGFGNSRFMQTNLNNRGIPHGRKAGLYSHAVLGLMLQLL